MKLTLAIAVASILGATALPALAHPYELGITIEPTIVGLPAFADRKSIPTTAIAAGGGLGFEFSPLKYLSITSRLAYAHGLTESHVGQATFVNRTGEYYFSQDAAYAVAGLRIETPTWFLPVQFFAEAQGGVAVLIQDQQQLIGPTGPYTAHFTTIVQTEPLIGFSGGMFGRVTDHVRLNAEGTAFLMPVGRTLVGFGFTLGITFLFFG